MITSNFICSSLVMIYFIILIYSGIRKILNYTAYTEEQAISQMLYQEQKSNFT